MFLVKIKMVLTRWLLTFCIVCLSGVECSPLYEHNDDTETTPVMKLAQYMEFKERMKFARPSFEEQKQILSADWSAETIEMKYKMDPSKVGFYVYTKNKPSDPIRIQVNDSTALKNSGYDLTYKTKILVHGFFNRLTSDMIQQIKNNFFEANTEDLNIIAVDWSAYTLFYVNVYEKTLEVGAIISDLINFLVREGTKLDDIHCIGHSLGAHGCGFAGAQVKEGLIGRISGLDPALPGFDVSKITSRLSTNDAKFVDCIHTCAGILAIAEPICTADFYPNHGSFQPGCPWYDAGACSHGRSHEFYAESILPGHVFPSLSCLSLQFLPDECTDNGALMGYPATQRYTGMLFTTTNDHAPYALNWTSVKT